MYCAAFLQYMLLKLCGARKESEEVGKIGVHCVMLHGRTTTTAGKESLAFLDLMVRRT